jgi:hypothetical protein
MRNTWPGPDKMSQNSTTRTATVAPLVPAIVLPEILHAVASAREVQSLCERLTPRANVGGQVHLALTDAGRRMVPP